MELDKENIDYRSKVLTDITPEVKNESFFEPDELGISKLSLSQDSLSDKTPNQSTPKRQQSPRRLSLDSKGIFFKFLIFF